MKKIIGIIAISLMLSACSSDQEASKQNENVAPVGTEETGKAAGSDKGLLNVEVTIPGDLFEEGELEEVVEHAATQGIKDVTVNEDGSVTYKMTKAQHKEMMKDMADNLLAYVEELRADESFASIYDITHNKDFSVFKITVEPEAFENSFDGFALFGLGTSGMFYQLYDGINPDKVNVRLDTIDEATGDVIGTVNYPEDLEDME